jgi:hypothetical protein
MKARFTVKSTITGGLILLPCVLMLEPGRGSAGRSDLDGSKLHAQTAATKAPARTKTDSSLLGTWRITRGVVAPWVPAANRKLDTKGLIGQTVRFESTKVTGPSILTCSAPKYEATSVPAEGLFQGNLKAPAKDSAQALGFGKFPVAGTSLNCSTGLFEFHQPDANTQLMALNNVIWTLDKSPGAIAATTTPAGTLQRFLEAHFAGDMGFDLKSANGKEPYLTPSLMTAIRKYFAKPAPKNEAPLINGDPFTDSQEYPTRFSVGAPTTTGNAAHMRVRFSDAYSTKDVTFVMLVSAGVWRIDDVRYTHPTSLRAMLTK